MFFSLIFTEEFRKNVKMKCHLNTFDFNDWFDLYHGIEVWTGDEQILSSYLYAFVSMAEKASFIFYSGLKDPSLGLLSRINKPAVDMSIITDR